MAKDGQTVTEKSNRVRSYRVPEHDDYSYAHYYAWRGMAGQKYSDYVTYRAYSDQPTDRCTVYGGKVCGGEFGGTTGVTFHVVRDAGLDRSEAYYRHLPHLDKKKYQYDTHAIPAVEARRRIDAMNEFIANCRALLSFHYDQANTSDRQSRAHYPPT